MERGIRYEHKKDVIRAELIRCAQAGKTCTYGALGERVGIPTQGPWKPVLDLISKEETAAGRPDITFVVIGKTTGFPAQIGFRPSQRPTSEQKELARKKLQEVFDVYCPGAEVPF